MPEKNIRIRTSVVCVHQNSVLGFRAIDPTYKKHYVFLPGGKIEENETIAQAARRETLEETGYEINLDEASHCIVEYPFDWDGRIYDCTTHFFTARLKDPKALPRQVTDASYHKGVCWIPLSECEQVFAYHPAIQKVVLKLVSGTDCTQSVPDTNFSSTLR